MKRRSKKHERMGRVAAIALTLLCICLFGGVAVAQEYGGTLIVPTSGEPASLAPQIIYEGTAANICDNIYSSLLVMDHGHYSYGDLAKSWEISADGLTYTFLLHENVTWHDGTPFTAEDVVFTYTTGVAEGWALVDYFAGVDEVYAPDDNTVIITLLQPNAAFISMLGAAGTWYAQILPKHLYEGTNYDENPYMRAPIGTGPFKFVEWVPGQYVELEKNEDYFREGRPYLDKLVFRFFTDSETAQSAFRAGEIDILVYALAPDLSRVEAFAEETGARMAFEASMYDRSLHFNRSVEMLNDVQVREAIGLLVDREQISLLGWGGQYPANYVPCSGMGTWCADNEDVTFPGMNVERANQLLDDAGHHVKSNGWRFKIKLTGIPYFIAMNEVIKEQLKAGFIDVEIEQYDNATYWQVLRGGDWELASHYARYGPDPDAYAEHWGTGGARNDWGVSSQELDSLFALGRLTTDETSRQKLYDLVQEILRRDWVYIPLTQAGYFEFMKQGVRDNPNGDKEMRGQYYSWHSYEATWWETEE